MIIVRDLREREYKGGGGGGERGAEFTSYTRDFGPEGTDLHYPRLTALPSTSGVLWLLSPNPINSPGAHYIYRRPPRRGCLPLLSPITHLAKSESRTIITQENKVYKNNFNNKYY